VPSDPHEEHGHLLLADIQRAASASGLPLLEAAWNIPRTLTAATQEGGEWPPGGNPLTDRPALVWDTDGILSFTAEALCVALNARFGTTYSPISQGFFPGTLRTDRLPDGQGTWIAGEMRQPAFAATYAPDFRAIDTLRDAHEAGHECLIATERGPELAEVTKRWLHEWGAPPVEVHAVGHGNKPAFMAARYGETSPAVLIDDNPLTQVTIARPGVQVWMPERPYTEGTLRNGARRFRTWAAVRYWLGLGPQA
jgi:hypothetical protein